MELIKEIKSNIIDSNVSISTVLRKAKVLASILKNDKLKEWTNNELNGYYKIEDNMIPEYRKFHAENYGHFTGPFGKEIKNAPIPLMKLPDIVKKYAEYNNILHGVKTLESISQQDDDILRVNWPADLILYTQYEAKIYTDMILVSAWMVVSKSQIEGIIDTIRNRLLDFILNLEENYPDLVKSEDKLKKIPEDKVNNYFITNIYGGQPMLASGTNIKQKIGDININYNFDKLKKSLKELDIPKDYIEELQKAIENDGELKERKLGKNVTNWFGKVKSKILSGSIAIVSRARDVAISEVLKAIMNYYGFNN